MSITWRAHLLISANHRMERFSKNAPWVIFNKITSSSMTLSEGNRHSFRNVWLMKGISHYIFQRRKIFCRLHFPDRAYLIPQWALLSPKGAQYLP